MSRSTRFINLTCNSNKEHHAATDPLACVYVFSHRADGFNRLASNRPQRLVARFFRPTDSARQGRRDIGLLYLWQFLGSADSRPAVVVVVWRKLVLVRLSDGAGGVLVCIEGLELSQWGRRFSGFWWGPGAPGSACHRPKADSKSHPFAAAPRDGRDARPTGRREKLIRAQSRRTTQQNTRSRGCKGCRGRKIKR